MGTLKQHEQHTLDILAYMEQQDGIDAKTITVANYERLRNIAQAFAYTLDNKGKPYRHEIQFPKANVTMSVFTGRHEPKVEKYIKGICDRIFTGRDLKFCNNERHGMRLYIINIAFHNNGVVNASVTDKAIGEVEEELKAFQSQIEQFLEPGITLTHKDRAKINAILLEQGMWRHRDLIPKLLKQCETDADILLSRLPDYPGRLEALKAKQKLARVRSSKTVSAESVEKTKTTNDKDSLAPYENILSASISALSRLEDALTDQHALKHEQIRDIRTLREELLIYQEERSQHLDTQEDIQIRFSAAVEALGEERVRAYMQSDMSTSDNLLASPEYEELSSVNISPDWKAANQNVRAYSALDSSVLSAAVDRLNMLTLVETESISRQMAIMDALQAIAVEAKPKVDALKNLIAENGFRGAIRDEYRRAHTSIIEGLTAFENRQTDVQKIITYANL